MDAYLFFAHAGAKAGSDVAIAEAFVRFVRA